MFKTTILSLLVIVASLCASCSPRTQPKEDAARQKKENLRQEVLQMSSKYGADLNWRAIPDDFYTLELQQALLEPVGRSRLLIATVVDVLKRENDYFLTVQDWRFDIYFQLLCDAKQAQYVIESSTNDNVIRKYGDYAIVLKPESVHKPVAQLTGEIDDGSAIVTHKAADIVVVKGTCIDILSLECSGLDETDLAGSQTP
jgi:hypothetical protein